MYVSMSSLTTYVYLCVYMFCIVWMYVYAQKYVYVPDPCMLCQYIRTSAMIWPAARRMSCCIVTLFWPVFLVPSIVHWLFIVCWSLSVVVCRCFVLLLPLIHTIEHHIFPSSQGNMLHTRYCRQWDHWTNKKVSWCSRGMNGLLLVAVRLCCTCIVCGALVIRMVCVLWDCSIDFCLL